MRLRPGPALLLALMWGPALPAAELQPRTAAAFDRYVAAAVAARDRGPFLWLDALAPAERHEATERLLRGGLSIARQPAPDYAAEIEIPEGLVHHWVGTVFVPGGRVGDVVALLRAYDRHDRIYSPSVTQSRVLARRGDEFHVFLRFSMKKAITVVLDSEHQARFRQPAPDRAVAAIRSTRIAQVEDPGGPRERELLPGQGGGYLWRLNTYWRILERDGGTFVECESISLTRGIPAGLGWLVSPFVTSIPRESLAFTLTATRRSLVPVAREAARGAEVPHRH
jgi:hypothetical protein